MTEKNHLFRLATLIEVFSVIHKDIRDWLFF